MFAKMIDGVNTYFSIVRTRRELNELSDAALADIGLARADIEEISVRHAPARRRPETAPAFAPASLGWTIAQPA